MDRENGFDRALLRLLLAGALLLLVTGACAPRASMDEPGIARKMDLRLRMALRGDAETPGDWIRVSVRLESDMLEEDRTVLGQYGTIGAMIGPILTMTLRPDQVVPLAREKRVAFIELEAFNVPTPEPPPDTGPRP